MDQPRHRNADRQSSFPRHLLRSLRCARDLTSAWLEAQKYSNSRVQASLPEPHFNNLGTHA